MYVQTHKHACNMCLHKKSEKLKKLAFGGRAGKHLQIFLYHISYREVIHRYVFAHFVCLDTVYVKNQAFINCYKLGFES